MIESKSLDGLESIQQHLELFVNDLISIQASTNSQEIGLGDTLEGISYLFKARVLNRFEHINSELMRNLAECLLEEMQDMEGSWGQTAHPTKNAELSLKLFGEFAMQVYEFQDTINARETSDLRDSLKLHRHLRSENEEHRKDVISILNFLSQNFARFSDWKDLVKEDEHEFVSRCRTQYQDVENLVSTLRPDALPPKGQYFDTNPDKVIKMFRTSVQIGLTDDEVLTRRERFGWNQLPAPPQVSMMKLLYRQLTDFIVLVLIVASAVSFGIDEIKSGVVLLIVVVINGIIGFSQEVQAERALQSLKSLSVPQATVRRNEKQIQIDAKELVPGDIVLLDEGMAIPADLRLVESVQLGIVESVLTGESEPVTKGTAPIRVKKHPSLGDRVNLAYMTTVVAKGRGTGVVVNTGITTEIGKIQASLTNTHLPATPLQIKLARLGKWLVVASVLACALVVVVGLARGLGDDIVKTGISLAVSVIPEGLVTVVTLTMALGMTHMARQMAIVRKLPSVETLGSVTTICSDKTGTLTEGKMKMDVMWAPAVFATFTGTGTNPDTGAMVVQGQRSTETAVPHETSYILGWAMMVASMCNNANLAKQADDTWKTSGDSTEIALAVGARRARMNAEFWAKNGVCRVREFAFDADRKRMSVICKILASSPVTAKDIREAAELPVPTDDAIRRLCGLTIPSHCNHVLLCKGASESILNLCTNQLILDEDGKSNEIASLSPHHDSSTTPVRSAKIVPLDSESARRVASEGNEMARQGMRVLALAIRFLTDQEAEQFLEIPKHDDEQSAQINQSESTMCFVGLCGIRDPPRAAVTDSIANCKAAGIRVVMITGDHPETATAIAKQIGIFDPSHDRVLKGPALQTMSEANLAAMDPFPVVFSRVTPDGKLKIVKALQLRGDVVAMTGDGVNDAAAIKQADVGIAMGISGTEITRQAADIILADDNFATIVKAVQEGRHIFDNITKFIVYLLSCNSSEVWFMFICLVADFPVPLLSMMILWANIIADIPPSLSLGVEPCDSDIMTRPPRDPKAGVFNAAVTVVIFVNGLVIALLTLAAYTFSYYKMNDSLDRARSTAFVCMVVLQLIHSFCTRSIHNTMFTSHFFANRWMLFAFVLSLSLTVLGVYEKRLQAFLELDHLSGYNWILILIASVAHVIVIEIEKLILRQWFSAAILKASKSPPKNHAVAAQPEGLREEHELLKLISHNSVSSRERGHVGGADHSTPASTGQPDIDIFVV